MKCHAKHGWKRYPGECKNLIPGLDDLYFKNRLTDRFFYALNLDRFLWTDFFRALFQTGRQKRVKSRKQVVRQVSAEQGFPCSV
jgi:hypothetical protein